MTEFEAENRRAHRRVVMTRETRIRHESDAHRARILNISAGGAGLQMEMRLPDGSEITLEIANIGLIPARVIRQIEDGVAVKFDFSEEKEQALIQRIVHLVARKKREQFQIISGDSAPATS